jgi:AcrR family transcriptional regulator
MKLNAQHIIAESLSRFKHLGIRSVSMDDISGMLGISKKTLYQFIKDKKDLVYKCMTFFLNQERKTCTKILEDERLNPVEQLIEIARHHSRGMKDMNPSALYDLQKYHPKSWQLMREYKEDFVLNNIKQNLLRGQEQGYYRSEIEVDVISKMYITLVDSIMNPQSNISGDRHFKELAAILIDYHLHAITTFKGRECLKQIEEKRANK